MAEVLVRDELIGGAELQPQRPDRLEAPPRRGERPLDELKAIKTELGGTVNDVVLAAAGRPARLLLARGEELPSDGLRAMVPVNVRAAGEQLALGNRITSLFVQLPVDEPDPRERYARQMDEAETLKAGDPGDRDDDDHQPDRCRAADDPLAARALALCDPALQPDDHQRAGPQQPLYAFGSRMLAVWPLVPLAAEHAVGLAIFSYDGQVFFCINADFDAVRDLDLLIAGIEDSVAELRRTCE